MKPKNYTRLTNQSLLFIKGFLMFCFFSTNIHAQIQVVSGGVGLSANYTSFTNISGLFGALNAIPQHGQVIVISITADVAAESGFYPLNEGSWTSIHITPSGVRSITGNIPTSIFVLNGADSVTIDGLNSGGNSLMITNLTGSSTANVSTIQFRTGATNNVLTNCTVRGSATGAATATILFSTDAETANGNDNNVISNNNIQPASGFPSHAILGSGSTSTTAIGNSGNIITNNNIFDYFSSMISSSGIATTDGCNTWTITNNRFYQTVTKSWGASGLTHGAMDIRGSAATSGAQGFTITGNTIGFASNTQTGTYSINSQNGKFAGIVFSGMTGGISTSISNNTIAGISVTGVTSSGSATSAPFTGILTLSGTTVMNDNTIGSQSTTASLVFTTNATANTEFYGIANWSSSASTVNNNTVGGIAVTANTGLNTMDVYGIYTAGIATISSNTIGGTVANSIQSNVQGGNSSELIGIFSTQGTFTASGNTIRNLTAKIGAIYGIAGGNISSVHTVSQNTIFNLVLTNSNANSRITGIQFSSAIGGLCERNFIYGLTTAATTAAEITGIGIVGGTFKNNMIALGAGISNAIPIHGFRELTSATREIYHNSVYIGGSPSAGTGNTFALSSLQIVNTRSLRNNIFVNVRSNTGTASGKNFVVQVGGSTPNPAGLTLNNNVYYRSGTGTVFGLFNSTDVSELSPGWKLAVGQDTSSFEYDPKFNDPTNAIPDLHIHPTNAGAAEGHGFDVGVTNDFDGQVRSGLTPVDIGADAGNFTFVADLTRPTITYTPLTNTASTANRTTTSFATITDPSGVKTSGGLAPRIYYKKLSDTTNTFNDNTSATTGWKFSSSGTGSSPFNFTINYTRLFGGSVSAGDVIQYFVVAQDSVPTPNVSINSGYFASTPTSVVLTAAAFPVLGTINSYNIGVTLNLKVFIESLYDPSIGKMAPVLFNQGFSLDSTAVDSITVELHNATTTNLVSSSTAILHTNGTGQFSFLSLVGNSFYIVYRHRNSLETWTKNPVLISVQGMTYDFTTP